VGDPKRKEQQIDCLQKSTKSLNAIRHLPVEADK